MNTIKKILLILAFLLFTEAVWANEDSLVVLNVKRYIYHNPDCKWAVRCTKSCIKTTKQKAQTHGARPCKVCGG